MDHELNTDDCKKKRIKGQAGSFISDIAFSPHKLNPLYIQNLQTNW